MCVTVTIQLNLIRPMTEEPVYLELDSYISDDNVERVLNGVKRGKATGLEY